MNCYKDCLARVIRGPLIDKLLICKELVKINGVPHWKFEPLCHGLPDPNVKAIKDSALKPIHNPGPGARDQTMDWAPVPGTYQHLAFELARLTNIFNSHWSQP